MATIYRPICTDSLVN